MIRIHQARCIINYYAPISLNKCDKDLDHIINEKNLADTNHCEQAKNAIQNINRQMDKIANLINEYNYILGNDIVNNAFDKSSFISKSWNYAMNDSNSENEEFGYANNIQYLQCINDSSAEYIECDTDFI